MTALRLEIDCSAGLVVDHGVYTIARLFDLKKWHFFLKKKGRKRL